MIDASKLKIPPGSLLVDISLVIALVYWGGQMTERLENMTKRLDSVEQIKIQPEADRRIAVIESQLANQTERLKSIEDKLDRALVRR
jgi:uncharacterized coiled-coil protein SlyX